MRNAQSDLNKLSFKEVRFDVDHSHARFDDLASTLQAGQSELSMSQQPMCILQAYETCDNAEWGSQFSQFMKCNSFSLVVATPDAMVDTLLQSLIADHCTKATNS